MSRAKPPGYLPAFCLSVILPNVLLAVLGLTASGLGADLGLTYLVWHDDPGKQFWVGFAFALVAILHGPGIAYVIVAMAAGLCYALAGMYCRREASADQAARSTWRGPRG